MTELTAGGAHCIRRPRLTDWLFNPFRYLAGLQALGIGLLAILLAGILGSFSNSHFDGTLDFHTGASFPLHVFLLEGIVDWLALALALVLLGKAASRTAFRAVDLFGTQAMARWPTVLTAAAALLPGYQRVATVIAEQIGSLGTPPRFPHGDLAVFGLVIVIMLLAIVWMVTLMYRSYSLCCNVRGAKGAWTFVLGLLAAEAVSKLIILKVVMP